MVLPIGIDLRLLHAPSRAQGLGTLSRKFTAENLRSDEFDSFKNINTKERAKARLFVLVLPIGIEPISRP